MQATEALVAVTGVTSGEAEVAVGLTIMSLGVMAMEPLCAWLGGANYNPAVNIAFWSSGSGHPGLHALRMVTSAPLLCPHFQIQASDVGFYSHTVHGGKCCAGGCRQGR